MMAQDMAALVAYGAIAGFALALFLVFLAEGFAALWLAFRHMAAGRG